MEIREAAAAYESATRFFLNLARGVTPELLDVHHENGWSARQIIHHMADSEAQSYVRLRRLVAEPEGVALVNVDEDSWAKEAKLGYETAPVENSIAIYASVRAGSLDVIKRLEESDVEKSGVHPESGKFTIEKWLFNYTKHSLEHGEQLTRATKGQE
jgi:hypothetical protein